MPSNFILFILSYNSNMLIVRITSYIVLFVSNWYYFKTDDWKKNHTDDLIYISCRSKYDTFIFLLSLLLFATWIFKITIDKENLDIRYMALPHAYFFVKKKLFRSWPEIQIQREREVETQAETEAGFLQEARYGTRSQDPEVMPWAEGRFSTSEPPRHPACLIF